MAADDKPLKVVVVVEHILRYRYLVEVALDEEVPRSHQLANLQHSAEYNPALTQQWALMHGAEPTTENDVRASVGVWSGGD